MRRSREPKQGTSPQGLAKDAEVVLGCPPGAESSGRAVLYHIEFRRQAEPGQEVLLEFADPAPACAVGTSEAIDTITIPESVLPSNGNGEVGKVGRRAPSGHHCAAMVGDGRPDPPSLGAPVRAPAEGLEILAIVAGSPDEAGWRKNVRGWVEADAAPAVLAKVGDLRVWWAPGRAAILAPAEEIQPAVLAIAELAFYEAELRRVEAETAAAWPEADEDTPLAYDVTARDLARQEALGRRTVAVFDRRIRQTRIEPHLRQAGASLPPAARRLGNLLRRKARIPERLESLDSGTEVYEYIYELASQRMGEYRNSRRERLLEIIIIAILLFETCVMMVDAYIYWWASPD
jgi:hypothetical protein